MYKKFLKTPHAHAGFYVYTHIQKMLIMYNHN